MIPDDDFDILAHEALDRLSCLMQHFEILYDGSVFTHSGLSKRAKKNVKKAFEKIAEAYQFQGADTNV